MSGEREREGGRERGSLIWHHWAFVLLTRSWSFPSSTLKLPSLYAQHFEQPLNVCVCVRVEERERKREKERERERVCVWQRVNIRRKPTGTYLELHTHTLTISPIFLSLSLTLSLSRTHTHAMCVCVCVWKVRGDWNVVANSPIFCWWNILEEKHHPPKSSTAVARATPVVKDLWVSH
jgi:hypothetical protein